MYSITKTQGQYLTYTLTDETQQSTVTVIPERGGIVTQWQWQGKEIFYLDQERLLDPALTVRGGIPILFPLCGGLPDQTYTSGGKIYQIPQHGFARNLPWTVVSSSTDHAAALTLTLSSNVQTRLVYPFDFQLEFTYSLQGGKLAIASKITNQSEFIMPFSLGFHPYFAAPDKTQLEFQIPSSAYEDHQNNLTFAFRGEFDLAAPEVDVIFRQLQNNTALVKDHAQGLQMTLEMDNPTPTFDKNFYRHLVFWTVKDRNFYCLEPWSAARNALNTQTNLTTLEPGTSLTTNWQMIVSQIQ